MSALPKLSTPNEVTRIIKPAADPIADSIVSRRMSDIEEKPIQWMIPNFMPRASIVVVAGPGGVGKGVWWASLVASVSTDGRLQNGMTCATGNVLLVLAEDSLEYVIKGRLRVAGANMERIYTAESLKTIDENGTETELALMLDMIEPIERLIEKINPVLIIIDPIGAFMGGQCDVNTDNAVRAVMNPIARTSERRNLLTLAVAHHRKSASSSADDLVLGSRAFTALARASFHVFDDDGRKLFLPGKSNLSRNSTGIAYTIENVDGIGRAVWEHDPVDMRADDWLEEQSRPGPDADSKRDAIEWLRDVMGDGRTPTKTELREQHKRDGVPFSMRTVERALKDAKVKTERDPLTKKWIYRLMRDGNNQPITGGDDE